MKKKNHKMLLCGFCSNTIPEDKAKERRKSKNKCGKFFCNHKCRVSFFYSDEKRHGGTKSCHCCKQTKLKSEFYFANKEKTRYAVDCKACVKKNSAERNRNNPYRVDIIRRCAYGMEPEQYKTLMTLQGGACAICGVQNKTLCVDHDHCTGRVRGLLCHACNIGLGAFKDNADFLKKAAQYIEVGEICE